jgi:hypothetical protein
MGYRIAIDTGGTFTELVLADEQGNMYLGKAPTTFGRIFYGIEGCFQHGCRVLKILSQQELEQGWKPRATNRDRPTRAATCNISGCRVIQIYAPSIRGFADRVLPGAAQPMASSS